jgi:hypothetical protein
MCQGTYANRLFLENQYGAEIVCKVRNGNPNDSRMIINNQDTPIANGVRVLLGLVPFDTQRRNVWATDVNIKASRYLPISSYASLNNFIDTNCIKILHACCSMKMNNPICKQDVCNKDAVIVIKPSGIRSEWDISVRWEKTRGVVALE